MDQKQSPNQTSIYLWRKTACQNFMLIRSHIQTSMLVTDLLYFLSQIVNGQQNETNLATVLFHLHQMDTSCHHQPNQECQQMSPD